MTTFTIAFMLLMLIVTFATMVITFLPTDTIADKNEQVAFTARMAPILLAGWSVYAILSVITFWSTQ